MNAGLVTNQRFFEKCREERGNHEGTYYDIDYGNDFKDDSQGLGWTECYRYAILQKDTIGTGNEKWKQSTKSIRCQPVRYIVIIIRC